MSQWGARGMAEQGHNFEQILGYGSVNAGQDRGQRLRRPCLEQRGMETLGEAQGIHQEFEGQLAGRDFIFLMHG